MKLPWHPTRLALSLMLLSCMTLAQGQTHDHDHDHEGESLEQGKHVHGEVTINVALEGNSLAVEVNAPALHVLGFERAARSAEEQRVMSEANAWLKSGTSIIGVPTTARCRLQSVEFTPPSATAKHPDYRASYLYRCEQPASLAWVELWALRRLKGVEKVEFTLLNGSVQKQLELGSAPGRIALR
ncbi:MAG: DUF2796 domain-containing protein [Sinobacteraceae bacterium]|nr:DUF2796 domain-containing protein [Nevskiaceae bacterium]